MSDAIASHPLLQAPIRLRQIQGSSAGSGSGDFHTYRQSRNYERERIQQMEREAKEEAEQKKYAEDKKLLEESISAASQKNRAKRQRKKERAKEWANKRLATDTKSPVTEPPKEPESSTKEQSLHTNIANKPSVETSNNTSVEY